MLVASNRISQPAPTVVICRGAREEHQQLKQKLADATRTLIELLESMKHDNTASCDRFKSEE